MKRFLAVFAALCMAVVLFAACGGDTSSTSAPATSSPATSVASPAQESSSASEAGSDASAEVEAMLAPLVDAANLGSTIEVSMLDVTASGDISADDIVAMAGAQSINYAENGGTVIVVQTVPGAADRVAAGFESYRDGVLAAGENYRSDYPIAYENMSNARIVSNGDFVIFAVSATGTEGGYEALDEALDATFA